MALVCGLLSRTTDVMTDDFLSVQAVEPEPLRVRRQCPERIVGSANPISQQESAF